MDSIKANTENLTSLWSTVGRLKNAFFSIDESIEYCIIISSHWPNRLWFKNPVNNIILEKTKAILVNSKVSAKVSYWYHSDDNKPKHFEQYGFVKSSEQTGTSLKLFLEYHSDSTIVLQGFTKPTEAILWSDLFRKAFNYTISYDVVALSCNVVNYFIVYSQNIPVGTCMLYHNNPKVVGIHSMGIIPEMRRRGIGEKVLKEILNISVGQEFKYATLQASVAAKPLYEKYGFTTQFNPKNSWNFLPRGLTFYKILSNSDLSRIIHQKMMNNDDKQLKILFLSCLCQD